MRNIKWALIGGVGVTTVAAGTMGGLYAHEVSKRADRIADKHFKSILDNINHIREATGLNVLSDDYDGFKDGIMDHIAKSDDSLKETVVDILEATVTEASAETQQQIDDNHEYQTEQKELLNSEVKRLSTLLDSELTQIKGGIVGDHDINYYKTLIEDSVGSTQFQDLSDDVATLDDDLDALKASVTSNGTKISNIEGSITGITTKLDNIAAIDAHGALTGGLLHGVVGAIDDLKTAAGITTTKFAHLDNTIEALKNNLVSSDESIKKDLTNVRESLATNTTTITRLDESVAELQKHVGENKLLIEDLKIEVNSLESKYSAITSTNKASIDTINTKLNDLLLADKELNEDLITKTDSLSNLYNDLKVAVVKNQTDILDLVLKYNNLKQSTTDELANLKKFFVDEQTQQNLAVATNTDKITKMELLVLTNAADIKILTDEIDAIKGQVAVIQGEVTQINETLKKFERKFAEIEVDLADAIQATDDLEVALRGEIDNNKAAILGLDARIAALENAPGGSSTDMLYKSTRVQAGHGLDLWNRPFFSPQDLRKYRRFEMFGYSYSTGSYFSIDFNVDTTRTVFDIAGGERLHPNRGWWKMKIDYINKKMNFTFFQEAGNASWVWYDQRGRMDIYEIYGIK